MLSKLKSRNVVLTAVAIVAMALVFVAVYDWGGDEDAVTQDTTTRIIRQAPTVAETPPPSAEPEEAPAEPEEAVVPEPPREVTYEEAETAFHERRYDDAVDLFTRYTERKSENPWGYYMLGLSAWKAGRAEEAESAFERALALDQRHVKSWINLSRVLLDSSRPSEALARLDEALAIDAESNAAYRLRGRAFHQLGRIDEAIESYRRAIQFDDTDAWSMNNMALVYIEQGMVEEALPPLARAVELRDDVAVFFNNLGMALERTGRFRAAEDAYTKAVAIDESCEKAHANLTRVADVLEDPAVEPVDLAALAQVFVEEIGSWSVATADSGGYLSVAADADSIVIGEASTAVADTTDTGEDW
jgi:tetratricopeptide (TPR) repeat protein